MEGKENRFDWKTSIPFIIFRQETTALTSLTNFVHHGMLFVCISLIFLYYYLNLLGK
jgi:hypothetical protein